MSDIPTPLIPPPAPREMAFPLAPFQAPVNGTLDQRLALVAEAINGKASILAPPAYQWLRLIDPSGQVWQITVDTTGTLRTALVHR